MLDWYGKAVGLGLSILVLFVSGSNQGKAVAGDRFAHFGRSTHLSYPVNPEVTLQEVGRVLLRPAAARAFDNMARTARQEGVHIVLRSGYRSPEHQAQLFYGVAADRGISLAARARVSAPPGYSEHHTGYAVDLDDGQTPRTLRQSFERTPAGKWLMENARRFCFELSFPRGNAQGIAYEPWHWRFIGSVDALRTFASARARYPGVPASDFVLAADGDDVGLHCGTSARTEAGESGSGYCVGGSACAAEPDQVADASRHAPFPPPLQN